MRQSLTNDLPSPADLAWAVETLNAHRHRTYDGWRIAEPGDCVLSGWVCTPTGSTIFSPFEALAIARAYEQGEWVSAGGKTLREIQREAVAALLDYGHMVGEGKADQEATNTMIQHLLSLFREVTAGKCEEAEAVAWRPYQSQDRAAKRQEIATLDFDLDHQFHRLTARIAEAVTGEVSGFWSLIQDTDEIGSQDWEYPSWEAARNDLGLRLSLLRRALGNRKTS